MEYIYATLTLSELDRELNQENITAVLEAAGADVIESRVKAIVAALEDVELEEIGFDSGAIQAAIDGQAVQTAEAGAEDADAEEIEFEAGEDDAAAVAVESDTEEDGPAAELFDLDEDESTGDEDPDASADDVEDESAPEDTDDGEEASPDENEDR